MVAGLDRTVGHRQGSSAGPPSWRRRWSGRCMRQAAEQNAQCPAWHGPATTWTVWCSGAVPASGRGLIGARDLPGAPGQDPAGAGPAREAARAAMTKLPSLPVTTIIKGFSSEDLSDDNQLGARLRGGCWTTSSPYGEHAGSAPRRAPRRRTERLNWRAPWSWPTTSIYPFSDDPQARPDSGSGRC